MCADDINIFQCFFYKSMQTTQNTNNEYASMTKLCRCTIIRNDMILTQLSIGFIQLFQNKTLPND